MKKQRERARGGHHKVISHFFIFHFLSLKSLLLKLLIRLYLYKEHVVCMRAACGI